MKEALKEALKEARKTSWMTTGVVSLLDRKPGSFQSKTEQHALEAIRMAADVKTLESKPKPIVWLDSAGRRRTYTADAKAGVDEGSALVEIKPKGEFMNAYDRRRYEEIGADLRFTQRARFCLIEWDQYSILARNLATLLRYWEVAPENVAAEAFARVGRPTALLGQLFDVVDPSQRKHIYAALFRQELVTDLRRTPLGRTSRIWVPSVERPAMRLDDLVTLWWA